MSKISIMLQLNRNWDNYGRYRDFQVDGIVVDEDASYSLLNSTIAEHLMIDTSEKIIEIKYIVNEHCPPMKIRNDMGVCVYMETKKENKSLGAYPLYITIRDFNLELSITNSITVAGSSGTLKLIDIPKSPAIVEYESIIITESTPNVIEVGQIYQDKQTIASAMKHYSVMNKFQFRVKRSSARSTFIQCKPTAMVVGSIVIPKYANPKTIYTPKDIQTDMLSEHGVNLTYMQASRAKKKALEVLRGHPADSYNKLPSYLYILEKTYPGSVVKLKKMDDDCFLPVVVVDGTFLKSTYKGIMLAASTMDATCIQINCFLPHNVGTILPLAYDVVDSENDASWKWFFEQFKHAYGERPNITWTMTSNIAESLNDVTKNARELPIVELLEYMRNLLERWTNEKLLKAKSTFTYLGFKFNKELDDNRTLSYKLRVRASKDYIHTVLDGVMHYIVCLENKRCSCGQFQLEELPCPHVLAALRYRDESFEQYRSPYYTRDNLLRTYEIQVNPLPDESKWNVPQHITEEVVNPPSGGKR
ncbi:uncharacterized protein [Nicotiana sylvestris]